VAADAFVRAAILSEAKGAFHIAWLETIPQRTKASATSQSRSRERLYHPQMLLS
jgi:hypothetical protein